VDGEPAVIHAGRLFPSPIPDAVGGTSVVATLAGAQPVGVVRDAGRAAVVLDHGGVGTSPVRPEGGVLVVPARSDAAWTSIAPIELMAEQEADDGAFEPPLRDARVLDGHDGIAVGRSGFVAQVSAPPGSRIVIGDFDPSVVAGSIVVPASGSVNAPFVPPMVLTANPRYRATLLVLTPAGHAYAAEWDVRVLTEPPEVEVTTTTPFASGVVAIDGTTEPYATVRVGGRPVEVAPDGSFTASVGAPPWPSEVTIEVSDELGNIGESTVSVVGLFDYRGLPWALLTAILVGVVAVAFFLRVPHSVALARPAGDDAALEELDGD
jgi:hypothetical protein